MNFYKKSKTKIRKQTEIFNVYPILIISSLIVMIFSSLGIFKTVPVFDIFNVTIGSFVTDFKNNVSMVTSRLDDNNKLVQQNLELRKQLIQNESAIGQIEGQQTEFDSLKKLNNVTTVKHQSVQARTIETSFSDKLPIGITIDKGKNDGVKEGTIAINDSGTLIGRVYSVSSFTSKIIPFYAEDFKIPVKSSSTQTAIVDSTKDGNIIVKNLSTDNNVKVGDSFFTSSLSDSIPAGIYIGRVINIDQDDKRNIILESDVLNISILYVYI